MYQRERRIAWKDVGINFKKNIGMLNNRKLDKVIKNYSSIELRKQLERLREWALAGIHIFELPAAINNSYDETEIDSALMQYCYYRLIYYLGIVV